MRSPKPFTSRFSLHISNRKMMKSRCWFCSNKQKQRRWNGSGTDLPNLGLEGVPPALPFVQSGDRPQRGHTCQGWGLSKYQGNETLWQKVFPKCKTRVWGLRTFNSPNSEVGILGHDSFKTGFYIYGNILLCGEALIWLCFRGKNSSIYIRIYVCVYVCVETGTSPFLFIN